MKFSIITPVRNGERFLVSCIESVLSQSYPDVEHIFVDGRSTDGTLTILAEYSKTHPDRIKYVSGYDNSIGEAWNKGLRMATGDVFGWLGADDILYPDALRLIDWSLELVYHKQEIRVLLIQNPLHLKYSLYTVRNYKEKTCFLLESCL